ncbi:parathyroid hormone 1a [Austrofundulus limnaeus]|uniref:Parathyroid hormone n=1 Tax=Austrofundulus limnaeus TaxID=52670 RepID=A0A2I4D5R3_AUSLI|nr:PREDICTED: parathyroid hormone [Austrofundulus limnaeus]
MQHIYFKILFVSLIVLYLSIHCQGHPLSKRTVSEVQLMHNSRHHKQVQERREWLQTRIQDIHNAAQASSGGDSESLRKRQLRPEELTELGDLTSAEIQQAIDFFEKLLESKQP